MPCALRACALSAPLGLVAGACMLSSSGLGGGALFSEGGGGSGGSPMAVDGAGGSGALPGSGGRGGAGGSGGAGGTGGAGGASVDPCADPSLVACFRFDGDSLDGSSAANHAATAGVQYVPSPHVQALEHGSGSLVTLAPSPTLGLSEYTMEAWLRPSALPTTDRWGIIDAPGRWSMWLYPDGVHCRGVVGTTIPANSWTHVACVHTGSTLHVYVDGIEVASGSDTLSSTPPTEIVHLGSDSPRGGSAFVGDIDELRIFDEARSAQQICEDSENDGC